MKKLLLFGIILTVCAIIVTFVFAQFYPEGMISYWKFDEVSGITASDSVDANHGTIYGATRTTGTAGNALSFDGVDDYVEIPDDNSLDITGDLTLEAWIEPDRVYYTAQGEIIGKWVVGNASYWFAIRDGQLQMRISAYGSDYYNIEETSVANLSINTWYHVVGVYDASEQDIKLYINGVVEESTTVDGIIPSIIHSGSAKVKIGGFSPGYYFDGIIDEVAVYNRALSAAEIEHHAQNGSYEVECVSPPSDMVSWWPGDETTSAITEDIVCANHGTLIGGATFASGKVEQALSLDGSGYVMIPNDPSLMPEQFTLDAWVKPVALRTTSWDSIISHGASGNDPHMGCCLDSYWLGFYMEKPTFHTAHVGVSGDQRLSGPDPVTLNAWHHIAGSFDGTTKKLYLDGNLVASSVIESAIAYEDVPVLIGEDTNNGGPAGIRFRGLIDEVEIYNRALEASEIQAIYLAGSAGKCKVIQVNIDIKPGSSTNSINLGSRGVIPVAILSSACFDATTVDPGTVVLAGARVAVRGKAEKSMAHLEDVNGDGLLDLVVQILHEGLPEYSQEGIAVLTGETDSGLLIKGSDDIIIVPKN